MMVEKLDSRKGLEIVKSEGMLQIMDEDILEPIIDRIIQNNPKQLQQYKDGNTKIAKYFVGQAMKETKGSANPQILNKIILEKLMKLALNQ